MRMGHAAGLSPSGLNHLAKHAPGDGGMEFKKRLYGDALFVALVNPPGFGALASLLFEIGLVITCPVGKLLEQPHNVRVVILRKFGQKLRANSVAQEAGVAVRRVDAELELSLFHLRLNLRPLEVQERPNDLALKYGIDSAQSARAGAAKQTHEHGLRLVVGGMRGGYPAEAALVDKRKKEAVAQLPGRRLQIPVLGTCNLEDTRFSLDKFQAERLRSIAHPPFILVRFRAAQVMIEMHHREVKAQAPGKLIHEFQQQDGVRSPGNGHTDPFAWPKHGAPAHLR